MATRARTPVHLWIVGVVALLFVGALVFLQALLDQGQPAEGQTGDGVAVGGDALAVVVQHVPPLQDGFQEGADDLQAVLRGGGVHFVQEVRGDGVGVVGDLHRVVPPVDGDDLGFVALVGQVDGHG